MSGGKVLKPGDLTEQLSAAAEDERSGRSFGALGVTLKKTLETTRPLLLEKFARGDIIAEKLSALMDEAIVAIFKIAVGKISNKNRLAVVATGGYGRGSIAPFSDIDLLVLHGEIEDETLKNFLNDLLYPLWDAGLIVGHGVHTPVSALKLASSDFTAMTAFLDARFIMGDEKLFKEFAGKLDTLRFRTKSKFVKAKMLELEERHGRSNQSRYLSEPDIKEGKGGLRDIHTIGWIYRALYGQPLTAATKRGALFRPNEIESLRKAERFLMSLRVQLHQLRGRADERLTFDIQPELADRLGYADRANISATERMMKHYFVNAVEIGRLTRIFWARIEEENAKLIDRAPTPLPKVLARDEAGGKVNLRIKNGRLDFASVMHARRNPTDIFRFFRAFSKRPGYDFHPDALLLIAQSIPAITGDVRRDPVNATLFVASITYAKDPLKLLRVMSETGFLGKYIPLFGKITGRIEYGLYRRYSLDEHIFQSIDVLAKLCSGNLEKLHPIATAAIQKRKGIETFFIAVLLHEAGWSLKDRTTQNTEALVGRVARRLGAGEGSAVHIAWCASRPLFMVRLAERRNLGELRAVANFAESVGSVERLDLLLVLTVCHLRVVSDTSWDEWTRRQISTLYFGARAWFESGEEGLAQWMGERASIRRREAAAGLSDWRIHEREAFLNRFSDAAIATLDSGVLTRAALLVKSAEGFGVAASPQEDGVEAIVYADDRPGLLADLAGAIANASASVRNVHAMTLDDGKVIDVFMVANPSGASEDSASEFVRRLHASLLAAADASPQKKPALARRVGDRRALFKVPSKVLVDEDASDNALVVEAEGLDRPGLLYRLSTSLAGLNLAIQSAHIATYGERAVDTFYLQTRDGKKLTDRRTQQAIVKRLAAVLDDKA
ncbi:MAG: [protein-PII] uridylyltransferase [Parvularculaceae bacterium]